MTRHKKSVPLLSNVLAYWRWYDEMAAGAALPVWQQNRRRPNRLSLIRGQEDAGRTDRTGPVLVQDIGASHPLFFPTPSEWSFPR